MIVETTAKIRREARQGKPIKAIARRMRISRNAVRRALAKDSPPRYQRPAKGSCVDGFEPAIRELLREYPTMPATVIASDVRTVAGATPVWSVNVKALGVVSTASVVLTKFPVTPPMSTVVVTDVENEAEAVWRAVTVSPLTTTCTIFEVSPAAKVNVPVSAA